MNKNNYKYYLPSYEDCKAICDKYDNFQFYESISYVDGYKISTFNYRLVGYNDFDNPLGDNSKIKAFELRGLTFVFDTNGDYKRFLLMDKFFNLNQVEETQFSKIKDIPIKYIYDKCDGSVINFIQLPNGRIIPKSKMCVDNDQALYAKEIYDNSTSIKEMVEWALMRNIMPIMEFVSPLNRVVLKYSDSELILLRFRNLINGEYLDLDIYPKISEIKTAQKEIHTGWDNLIELSQNTINKEGWVVTLENGMMIKLKTKWYFELHGLLDNIYTENKIIEYIINDEIDDVISKIDSSDKEVLNFISDISTTITDYLHNATKIVETRLEDYYNKYNSSRKDFVMNYGVKDKYFGYIMSVIDNIETPISAVTKDLKKYTYRLEKARLFLKNKDF